MGKKVVFFDDFPLFSENQLFLERLARRLHSEIEIVVAKTVKEVERVLSKEVVDVVILDLMAAVPKGFKAVAGSGNDEDVKSSVTGVEILRRCRGSYYGERVKSRPIFIRTARSEPYIRAACLDAGATGFFSAGGDDGRLIEIIESHVAGV